METIRQIVQINSDRKLEINLPPNIEPGLVEVVVVVQSLNAIAPNPKQKTLDALQGLAEIRKNLPPVDAVELVRASREELEQRGQQ